MAISFPGDRHLLRFNKIPEEETEKFCKELYDEVLIRLFKHSELLSLTL